MITPIFKRTLIILTFLLISPALAYSVELNDVLNAVQKTYAEASDLQAEFDQEKTFEGFKSVHRLNGTVYLKKPGFMRWDYQTPSKQQIFLKDNQFTYYIPEHKQVVVSPLSQQQAQDIPIHLLSSIANLENEYTLEWETEPSGSKNPYRIYLQSKKAPAESKILVEINPQDSLIHKIFFSDPNGNTSTFTFFKFKINKGISDEFFNFTVPKDVEVVHPPPTMVPTQ